MGVTESLNFLLLCHFADLLVFIPSLPHQLWSKGSQQELFCELSCWRWLVLADWKSTCQQLKSTWRIWSWSVCTKVMKLSNLSNSLDYRFILLNHILSAWTMHPENDAWGGWRLLSQKTPSFLNSILKVASSEWGPECWAIHSPEQWQGRAARVCSWVINIPHEGTEARWLRADEE